MGRQRRWRLTFGKKLQQSALIIPYLCLMKKIISNGLALYKNKNDYYPRDGVNFVGLWRCFMDKHGAAFGFYY